MAYGAFVMVGPRTPPILDTMNAPPMGPAHPSVHVSQTPTALGPFFWLALHAPGLAGLCQPAAVRLVQMLSHHVRRQTRRNATRIFGRELGEVEQAAFTRGVVNHFYEFVTDVGRSCRERHEQLLARIVRVEGEEGYAAARALGRGAVLVTAHMGSFEVGLGALRRVERRIHVVFKRDESGPFEKMRSRLRRTLGVVEAPIDDGLKSWIDLRDALMGDAVVVLQADRAVPGQRSIVVPFMHGHLRLPSGPVRLARMTGSPIIPVFTLRVAPGRFVVQLHAPIDPNQGSTSEASPDATVLAIARAIESVVAHHPEQWLALEAVFEEDLSGA